MSLAPPISPSLLSSQFSSSFHLPYQQPQSNGRKRASSSGTTATTTLHTPNSSSEVNQDSSRPAKIPKLSRETMSKGTLSHTSVSGSTAEAASSSCTASTSSIPYNRSLKHYKEQRERRKAVLHTRSPPSSTSNAAAAVDLLLSPVSLGKAPSQDSYELDSDPFAPPEALCSETSDEDLPRIELGSGSRAATLASTTSTCTSSPTSHSSPASPKPSVKAEKAKIPLPHNPSQCRQSKSLPLFPSPLSRDPESGLQLQLPRSFRLDERSSRQRSSRCEPNLLKQAIKTRMLESPEGKKILCMGARLAVSIGEATRELERIVKESNTRELELERVLGGPLIAENDYYRDGDGDTVMDDASCPSGLSKSWILIPGEDWEMVDCAA